MNLTTANTTFAVADVRPATKPLLEVPYREAVTRLLDASIEACSRYHGKLVAGPRLNPLVGALHSGFQGHHPVVLSPDIIWLTLCQGFAHHVNTNAEQLRSRLVKHSGKPKIIVRRDDFIKGSPENPWPEVFAEFSAAIRKHIGDTKSLLVGDFSTTGPVERAASEIVLLDAMQAYFKCELWTLCGIPSITLEGTPDDWRQIASRVREFERFDLAWWIGALSPILEQFVAASEGDVDRQFWNSIYKWHGPIGSGSPYVTGWVLNLFPYVYSELGFSLDRNRWLLTPSAGDGPGVGNFPAVPAKAPFKWIFLDASYDMEFVGGLLGVAQDPATLSLRPEIGWAIREVEPIETL
jgi:hypothetical protein